MKKNQYYAVVDLETTGSSFHEGDRIIQIGIVLLQNGKIVQSYETDVNPLRKIPPTIQHITGITQKMVTKAPYFEDVAGFISNLLSDCIFIAHNILFDYRFLSDELEKAGYPPLTISGIDTVQLAQILLPYASGYSLGELSRSLDISLNDPHHALSDATATAELFIHLQHKALQLPLVTLEKLHDLSVHCLMQTYLFFEEQLKRARSMIEELHEDLFIQDKIAFRKPEERKTEVRLSQDAPVYPQTPEQKQKLFASARQYRKEQAKIMDTIFAYFSNPSSLQLAVEAPAGIGKTFGYLLPASYFHEENTPIVISTYTVFLQQQIIDKEMKELQAALPFPVTFALLKSGYHYIDVQKWKTILKKEEIDTAEALYSMRILVWLTETRTGDLDELNIQNDSHRFWENIRYKTQPKNQEKMERQEIDYYSLSRQKAAKATFIITNHSFLAHHLIKENSEFPSFHKLIIDEAHRFPEVAQLSATQTFHSAFLISKLKYIGTAKQEQSLVHYLHERFDDQIVSKTSWELLDQLFGYVNEETTTFFEEMIYSFFQETNREERNVSHPFSPEMLNLQLRKQLKNLTSALADYTHIGFRIIRQLSESELDDIRLTDRFYLDEWYDALTVLNEQKIVLQQLQPFAASENSYFWIRWSGQSKKPPFSLHLFEGSEKNAALDVLKNIPKVLYISSTLALKEDFSYFEKRLNQPLLKTKVFDSEFDYAMQTRFFVPKNLPAIKELSADKHAKLIADSVGTLAAGVEENILVLFTSHDILNKTYQLLMKNKQLDGREILAQSISGTREKITKRFFRSQGGILLGAESFWEGLDMPGDSLRFVIVTRLPFEFPDQPITKARHSWLRSKNQNPFTIDTLPKAAIRLKQSYGRLIRNKEDKGVYILLDNRLLTSSYARYLQQAFPPEVPITVAGLEEIEKKSHSFLQE